MHLAPEIEQECCHPPRAHTLQLRYFHEPNKWLPDDIFGASPHHSLSSLPLWKHGSDSHCQWSGVSQSALLETSGPQQIWVRIPTLYRTASDRYAVDHAANLAKSARILKREFWILLGGPRSLLSFLLPTGNVELHSKYPRSTAHTFHRMVDGCICTPL
jgi:hypothetical protein